MLGVNIVCMSMLFISIRRIYFLLFTIHSIDLTIDHRIAQDKQIAITQAVDELSEKTMAYAPIILETIKKKFSVIDTISVSFLPVNECSIQIKACEPVVRVNTDWVYTQKGTLLARSTLLPRIAQTLDNIQIQCTQMGQPHMTSYCAQFIDSLSALILDTYTINWIDEHEIYLQDKIDQDFSILVQCATPLVSGILGAQAIKADLKKRGRFAHLNNTQLVADTRFDGQIVVREQEKGEYETG